MPDTTSLTDIIRNRIERRLRLFGEGPAAFFVDACRLLVETPRKATSSHLVGHLMREIESGVRAVLHANLTAPPPAVTNAPAQGTPPKPKKKATGAEDGHAVQVRTIMAALGFAADHQATVRWLQMTGSDAPKGLPRLAHRDALRAPRSLDDAFVADWEGFVLMLDQVLDRFEVQYATIYQRLDALLALEAPTAADVQALKQELPNTSVTLNYFFERLTRLEWLPLLRAEGFFVPPPAEVDQEKGTITFPVWAQAKYLSRVAEQCPKDVADVITAVAATDNVRAQGELIAAALRLPVVLRVQVAPVVEGWLPLLSRYYWGAEAPEFVTSLAGDGEVTLALRLTSALLALPQPDAQTGQRPVVEATLRNSSHSVAMQLRKSSTNLAPALIEAAGPAALVLFADALDYYAGRRPGVASENIAHPVDAVEGLSDMSPYWLDDFDGDGERRVSDLRVLLAHIVRNGIVALGQRIPDELGDVLRMVRERGARIIRRAELDALARLAVLDGKVGATALGEAENRLLVPALATEDELAGEYVGLLGVALPRLTPDAVDRVLDVATAAPDFSWLRNEEHERTRTRRWVRDRLAAVKASLPEHWKERLRDLVEHEGAAQPARRGGSFMESFIGPTSPKSVVELREMSIDDLVSLLTTWEAAQGWAEPTPDGLARPLQEVVRDAPEQYSAAAERFVGVLPVYVHSVLEGLSAAVRANTPIAWRPVLTLAEWVVTQAISEDDRSSLRSGGEDFEWRSTRQALANLVGLGLSADHGAIGASERDRVWRILMALASDTNPTPAYEAEHGGEHMDPGTLAINTVRPEAIDAVIRYAFWVREAQQGASGARREDGFAVVPEAAGLIEAHLDPTRDASVSVRAAIGAWLGELAVFDRKWVSQHLSSLLPTEASHRQLRTALWDAFLRWSQPSPRALEVLAPYYREAIDETGSDRGTELVGGDHPDDRLAEHVMTLYWWGEDPLSRGEARDSLAAYLFERADAARRAKAIQFVGSALLRTPPPVAPEPLQRLMTLWDWRFLQLAEIVRAAGEHIDHARGELAQFGWWFASRAFDPKWSLGRLKEVVGLVGMPDLDVEVFEHLAELSGPFPDSAVAALAAFDFAPEHEPWRVAVSLDEIRQVVTHGLAKETANAKARQIANRLVAAGYTDFRDLT